MGPEGGVSPGRHRHIQDAYLSPPLSSTAITTPWACVGFATFRGVASNPVLLDPLQHRELGWGGSSHFAEEEMETPQR